MEPIKFKQANCVLSGDGITDDQGLPVGNLHVYNRGGKIVSCWTLTLRERIKIMFTKRLWLHTLCADHPPTAMTVDNPFKGE